MTREEAICRLIDLQNGSGQVYEAIRMAIEALSADAVPFDIQLQSTREVLDQFAEDRVKVVRCKDCRFYWGNLCEDDTDEMYGECRWDGDEMPNADDFCSYGERREE